MVNQHCFYINLRPAAKFADKSLLTPYALRSFVVINQQLITFQSSHHLV